MSNGAADPVLTCYAGRPVVVTGCSSGIGEAVAGELIKAGADVIGIDRKEPAVTLGQFFQTDMGSEEEISRTAARLPQELFAVFSCAGLSGGAADPRTVLRVNFIGLRELIENVVDRIPGGGAIVNVSSLAGAAYDANLRDVIDLARIGEFTEGLQWLERHEAYVNERGAYPVSKEAVILYTIDRSRSLGERNVRINCVAPGVTDTPMLIDSIKVRGEDHFRRPPQPLGRRATALEQARIMIFLNSSWASYVNGQVLWSDGGQRNYRLLPCAGVPSSTR
jgi:NAD(P)-dependent dehydrogenase (short-subunit alcohol dehydrogenase family)